MEIGQKGLGEDAQAGKLWAMKLEPADSRRKYPRIGLPKGMWVAWQAGAERQVSRVKSLSLGGLFISTQNPAPIGTLVRLLFEVPGGEVRARGIVKRCLAGEGMGIQFSNMGHDDRARLHQLLSKLLKEIEDYEGRAGARG